MSNSGWVRKLRRRSGWSGSPLRRPKATPNLEAESVSLVEAQVDSLDATIRP